MSLPLCVSVISFSNARPRGNVGEAPSAKVQRGDFSVLHELQRRDERLSFLFFFVEGEMESSSLTAHSDHLSRFMKKKNTPGFLNGAFERDTREKGVGSPPSQTQRIWPVFKNEAARADSECVSCTKKKKYKGKHSLEVGKGGAGRVAR